MKEAAMIVPTGKLFIDGGWRDPAAGGTRDVVDPANGKVITTVAEGGAADVDAAVAAARRAFDEGPWPRMSGRERGDVLLKLAGVLQAHREELAQLESLDTGKPIFFARMVDLGDAIDQYTYYGSLASTVQGATRSIRRPGFAYTSKEPLGVVGAISPFNFPLILSSSKIAPALAAGNTVVHKPAEDTPLTALRLAELFAEAGLPPGVLNVVTGGAEAGAALVRHPGVDKIGFTGSTATGRAVAAAAADAVKPTTMELGGKSAQIIFEDSDLGRAIECAVNGFVFNTGQFCMGGTRLLVHSTHYDTVLGALAEAATHVPVGDPRQETTIVGPMAGLKHLENVERYIALGEGRVVAGGKRLDIDGGYYYAPTVLADVANDSRVVQEEIFGPVLTVQSFETEDEAVALANSTPYGLAAALHTNDVARAHRVAARLRAGIVWVNSYAVLDASLPFGGVGQSGYGRENGPEGLEAYLQTKSVFIPTD
jgi:acyl-CoA reductase-like NAD-dependent aldehyde dehydrogenase